LLFFECFDELHKFLSFVFGFGFGFGFVKVRTRHILPEFQLRQRARAREDTGGETVAAGDGARLLYNEGVGYSVRWSCVFGFGLFVAVSSRIDAPQRMRQSAG
jgi:hypothetical protein